MMPERSETANSDFVFARVDMVLISPEELFTPGTVKPKQK